MRAHIAWGHFVGKFTSKNDNPKSFLVCSFKQNWMAFTNLRVQNFTLADSLAFTNNRSLSRSQENFALCQVYIRKIIKGNIFKLHCFANMCICIAFFLL